MLTIAKGITSEYVHAQTQFHWFISQIALTALKYETQTFQEFRTHNRTTCLFDHYFIYDLGLGICFISED